ncbi:MAG: OmpA family protein [Chitinivibrionales bacterium]
MAVKKKKKESKKGAPEYMTTYGDMMTLLLCFFVLLLAMSTIDEKKFMVAASSFQNAFSGVLKELPTIPVHENIMMPRMGGDEQNKHMAVESARRIRKAIEKHDKLKDAVKVKVTDSGIAIKISDPVGFDQGKAEIKPAFEKILQEVADVIRENKDTEIRIEGHTDDTPISTAKYPSNWELSSARAIRVVKYLYRNYNIDPKRMSGVGYGEYRPLVSNTSPENRKKNRRIEIYVEYLEKKDKS